MNLRKYLGSLISFILRKAICFITGTRSFWTDKQPTSIQKIYYTNHTSHIDFILLWSSLPREIREVTRPVAGGDYWHKTRLRRFIISDVFQGIMISSNNPDSLFNVKVALNAGHSVIFFPEGTRNLDSNHALLPFKSGLFHLSQAFPEIDILPVWIENVNRVMPKGTFIPLPILSNIYFGTPLSREIKTVNKDKFLQEARTMLINLSKYES